MKLVTVILLSVLAAFPAYGDENLYEQKITDDFFTVRPTGGPFTTTGTVTSKVLNFADEKFNDGVYAALACVSEYRIVIITGEMSIERAFDSCKGELIKK